MEAKGLSGEIVPERRLVWLKQSEEENNKSNHNQPKNYLSLWNLVVL